MPTLAIVAGSRDALVATVAGTATSAIWIGIAMVVIASGPDHPVLVRIVIHHLASSSDWAFPHSLTMRVIPWGAPDFPYEADAYVDQGYEP